MQFCQTIQKQIRNHQTTEDGLVKSITVTVTYVSKKTSEATKDELVMYNGCIKDYMWKTICRCCYLPWVL